MKRILFTICTLWALQASAQYNPTIRSARPGQSVGPFTTGKNVFQVQTGLTYNQFGFDNSELSANSFVYLASLRYGILEKLEIRSAFGLSRNSYDYESLGSDQYGGLSLWNVGARYNILNGGGTNKPSLGIQADVRLTAVDEDYAADNLAPRIMLIYGQQIAEKLALTSNWAVVWSGNDTSPAGTYTLNLSFPLAQKWGGFIENYGVFGNGDLDNRWNTGVSYLVTNDFLLDLATGFGKNDGAYDWFVDAGVSWRVKFK